MQDIVTEVHAIANQALAEEHVKSESDAQTIVMATNVTVVSVNVKNHSRVLIVRTWEMKTCVVFEVSSPQEKSHVCAFPDLLENIARRDNVV